MGRRFPGRCGLRMPNLSTGPGGQLGGTTFRASSNRRRMSSRSSMMLRCPGVIVFLRCMVCGCSWVVAGAGRRSHRRWGKGQDALPRGRPFRPLGNAATRGRAGQSFSDRPSPFVALPLPGRRRWDRREFLPQRVRWGVGLGAVNSRLELTHLVLGRESVGRRSGVGLPGRRPELLL